jgi:amino acid transporter
MRQDLRVQAVAEPVAQPVNVYKLAKVLGIFAVMASAVAHEYGASINFVTTQILSVYPRIEGLVPLAFVAAGLAYLPKTYLYMRFSRHMPRAGSSYVWVSRTVNLPTGFGADFMHWVGLTAAMGTVSFACVTFLAQALTTAGIPAGAALTSPLGRILLGTAIIWLIFAAHTAGVDVYGKLVSLLFWFIVVAAGVVIVVGFATNPAHFTELARANTHLPLTPPATSPGATLGAFLGVTAFLIGAYGGITGAPALGGEAREASRTVPLGVMWGWIVALVLYTLVAFALFHATPWWVITALISGHHENLATAPGLISVVAPPWVGVLLQLLVAVVVGKTIAPEMLVASRLVFAWGQDGLFPPLFAQTSSRKVPVAALVLSAALGTVFLVQATFIGWALGVIRPMAILLVLLFVAIGALNARYNRRFRNVEWAHGLGSGPAILAAILFSLVVVAILWQHTMVLPKTPIMFQPFFQGIVAVLVAAAIYVTALRRARRQGVTLGRIATELPLE